MNYYYDSCGEISLWCREIFYTHLPAAHVQGRHEMQEVPKKKKKKSFHWIKLLQGLSSIFVNSVAFCFCLYVCFG